MSRSKEMNMKGTKKSQKLVEMVKDSHVEAYMIFY